MTQTYEAAYDHWHRAMYDGVTVEPTAPWHLMARKHLPELVGKRVLEIGCGPGAFARWLAEQGAEVVAGDISREACRIARRVCAGVPVDIRRLDAQDLVVPLGPKSFDIVVCLETLEHVPDHDRALREIVEVTRPGGGIFVSTPNYLGPVGLHRLALRLAGRRFDEMGQPINNVMVGYARVWKLRRLGCRVDVTDGVVHHLPIPGRSHAIPLRFLERPAFRYLARHVLVVATKLASRSSSRTPESGERTNGIERDRVPATGDGARDAPEASRPTVTIAP